ncbi:MAG: hypothetical protein IT497_04900 [Ottowia sp.]|nr:hypothetical protein [Ottowia sp.]
MLDIENTFAKLLGRQPSEKEVQNLYRVKNTLGIGDNDALWQILMALESYDTLYRKYPAIIASQVEQITESQRTLMATIADTETKKALGTLAHAVSRTSETIAVKLAEASRLQSWGWVLIGFVLFGSLCTSLGFVLGSGHIPYWAENTIGQSPLRVIFGTLAQTPAGWIAAIGGTSAALSALWQARAEIKARHRLGFLAGSILLTVISCSFLWPVFGGK